MTKEDAIQYLKLSRAAKAGRLEMAKAMAELDAFLGDASGEARWRNEANVYERNVPLLDIAIAELENAAEPRGLRYTNKIFLIARDRAAKMMYLGGLGAMGVGEMWSIEEFDPASRFENWETAPEKTCPTAECRCIADCPRARPDDFGPHASWPRCWLPAGHDGQHSIGYAPKEIRW